MNTIEINKYYDVTRYEDEHITMLVLPAYKNLVPVNLVKLAEANNLPIKDVKISRNGAVELNGEVITLSNKKPELRKVALLWEHTPRTEEQLKAETERIERLLNDEIIW